jgi:hypothetical protein
VGESFAALASAARVRVRPLAASPPGVAHQGSEHMNRIVFIGPIGSDAGGWYIGKDGKLHRFPGWNPEAVKDLGHALAALREASQILTPGVAERAYAAVHELISTEIKAHLEQGDVLVIH